MRGTLWLLLAGVGMAGGALRADPEPLSGDHRSGDHTHHRAGYPQEISCLAKPTETKAYVGYTVGGGSAWRGRAPGPCEGTWGWDYCGCVFPRRVMLGWTLKGRHQGGTGAYKTDGPHLRRERE